MADLPTAPRFDLTVAAQRLFYKRRLHEVTVPQAIAFDCTNGHLFATQLVGGGKKLPGETAPLSGVQRAVAGDLAVTRLDYAGNITGWMLLRHFGHGVAFGAEPAGADTYLWIECDPKPGPGGAGYGTRVARLRFVPSGLVSWPSAAIETHTPVPGAAECTVSLDWRHRTLLLRYRLGGGVRYRLYDVDRFRAGDYTPLAETTEQGIADVFQGHAHSGTDVYRLEGRSRTALPAPTFVSCQDLLAGQVVQRLETRAGDSLTFREPEGLAIQCGTRLHLGLADGTTGARNLSVYWKEG